MPCVSVFHLYRSYTHRHPPCPVSVPILHPRETNALCSQTRIRQSIVIRWYGVSGWTNMRVSSREGQKKGSSLKQVYLGRLWSTPGAFQNQVKSAPYESCHWSKARCTCFGRIKPRYTRFVYSAWLTTVSCLFLANQRPSIVPPYAPHTNADVRGDPLHPPFPTPCHTSNTRSFPRTSAEMRHTDTNMNHGQRRRCVGCSKM